MVSKFSFVMAYNRCTKVSIFITYDNVNGIINFLDQ